MDKKIKKAKELKEKGNTFYKQKNFQRALYYYQQAIEMDPNNEVLYLNRAVCFIQQEQIDAAVSMCKKAQAIKASVKGYYRLGQSNCYLGQLDESEKAYIEGIEFCEKSGDSSNDKFKEIFEKEVKEIKKVRDNYKEAREMIGTSRANLNMELVLKKCFYSLEFHVFNVDNLIAMKKFDEAFTQIGRIWNKFEDKSSLFFLRGKIQYYLGNPEAGSSDISMCLRLDPNHSKCVEFRKNVKKTDELKIQGNNLFKEGKAKEADELYSQAIAVDELNKTMNAQLYCNKAACKMKLKDWKMAKRDCNKAIGIDKDYQKAYLRRGTCNIHLEQYESAVTDFSEALRIQETPEIRQKLQQAQQLAKQNKRKDYYKLLGVDKDVTPQQAKKAFHKKAMKLHPDRFDDPEERKEAEEQFKEINQAYQVLSDPKKKQRYDLGMDDVEGGGMGGMGGMGGVDINDIFSMFMGGGGGGGMGGGSRGGGMPGGFSFSFGDGGGGRSRRGGNSSQFFQSGGNSGRSRRGRSGGGNPFSQFFF